MEKYILSEIFTLIPKEIYTKEMGIEALTAQFDLQGDCTFGEYEYKDAVIAFAFKDEDNKGNLLPLAIKLLIEATEMRMYNKCVFHYNKERKIAHIIICMGEELCLATPFKADSFESALYFLFLSITNLQMNPRQCTIKVCSSITQEQEKTIAKFFNGVEEHNIDNLIEL